MMLGKVEDRRRRGQRRMRWVDGITDSMDIGLGGLRELVTHREAWPCCSPWGRKELDTTEQQNNKSGATFFVAPCLSQITLESEISLGERSQFFPAGLWLNCFPVLAFSVVRDLVGVCVTSCLKTCLSPCPLGMESA